jgi:hypothetical protein
VPAADTARLIASLELQDRKFQQGSARVLGSLNKIEGRLGAVSGFVNRNLGRALDKAASIGVNALVDGIKGGVDSLATLEDATTSVDGAIKQMGLTGQVTAGQIATWANEIEASTQAAFDDKDITRNAATLIRYGRVTSRNLRPALEVMTDLAAKTGSVDSASTLLARALADPTKAAGKLSRAGVILTKQQQDQIKALVKAGKVGKAQALVLDAIGTATKNAARDSAGPFRDMQNQLNDTKEDAERLLATAAFPVLQKIGTKLQAALADPRTMKAIEGLGQGAAQALDKVLAFAETVDWGAIADGLGKAAGFAGDLIGAFAHIPPEAQAFVIGLVGLNKLTGGAVTGIVGELGKGLIKGVLGMTAGVVNLKAGTVVGGGVGAAGAASGGAGVLGKVGTLVTKVTVVGIAAEVASAISQPLTQAGIDLHHQLGLPDFKLPIPDQWPWGPKNTPTILPEIFGGNGLLGGSGSPRPGGFDMLPGATRDQAAAEAAALKAIGTKQDAARATFEGSIRAVDRTAGTGLRNVDSSARTGLRNVDSTTRSGTTGTTSAVNAAAARISGAVVNARPIVTTSVEVNVTATSVQKATTTSTRYGPINGSAGGGTGSGGTAHNKYD